jgi:hypothetical protein
MTDRENNVNITIRISLQKREQVKEVLKSKDKKLGTVLKRCITRIIEDGNDDFLYR